MIATFRCVFWQRSTWTSLKLPSWIPNYSAVDADALSRCTEGQPWAPVALKHVPVLPLTSVLNITLVGNGNSSSPPRAPAKSLRNSKTKTGQHFNFLKYFFLD